MTTRRMFSLSLVGATTALALTRIEIIYGILAVVLAIFIVISIWIAISGYGRRATEIEQTRQKSEIIADLVSSVLSVRGDEITTHSRRVTYFKGRARVAFDIVAPATPGINGRMSERAKFFGDDAEFGFNPDEREYYLEIKGD